jgi:hypothetical protein
MRILFCRPDAPQAIDDRFELEADALDELGVRHDVIAMEAVVDDELERALDPIGAFDDDVLYRGWMLTAEEYARLDAAVAERGGALITSPDEYEAAHYLPSWFGAVERLSPATRWVWGTDLDEAWAAACALGPPPYVVKDHVKSVKERWHEACFVPPGAGRDEFVQVCEALIDARGERFERGLVVRRHMALAAASGGEGERDEYRLFFWRGQVVAAGPYHDVPGADDVPPNLVAALGRAIDVPYFSADVARTLAGDWIVIELGDGGVSMMPPTMDPRTFYRAIR